MSTFVRRTKNPQTGKFEDAVWLDDYYGAHKYGVMFPSNQSLVYYADGREWEFEDSKPEVLREP